MRNIPLSDGCAFFLKKKSFLAFGVALKNGQFLVLKGSHCRLGRAKNLPSYRKKAQAHRDQLFDKGIVVESDGIALFVRDHTFKTISDCSSAILGQSRSGNYWFNAVGQSYPQWKKQSQKPSKTSVLSPGTKIDTKTGERFLVSRVVTNKDRKGRTFFEYFLVPEAYIENDGFLVPEKVVLKKLPTSATNSANPRQRSSKSKESYR